ncbi:LuxR C-terminal-related transcriptional regulator [Amycolatopsis sp. NPDC006125]|uniref:LuxR C-terminal-related transcriptional regulator n=1 Tax=Amycolatopsis sp. NPDC006125 TaxID=3156730 RepID=UPI0033B52CCD
MHDGSSLDEFPAELRRIVGAQDWDELEDFCDRHWLALPADLAATLVAALGSIPPEVLHGRPRLVIAWLTNAHALAGPADAELRAFLRRYMEVGARMANQFDLTADVPPATLIALGTAKLVQLRGQGSLDEADELGEQLARRVDELRPLPRERSTLRPGWLALQRGLTRSLAGDLDGATALYQLAHEQARAEPLTHFAGINAAANLAMVFAHQGQQEAAARWIKTMRSYPPPMPSVAFLGTVGATIAEGWLALDRHDRDGVAAALAVTGDGTKPIELWPFVAALVGAAALHFGDPADGLDQLERIRISRQATAAGPGIAQQVLDRARADLLIAAGQGNRALRMLRRETAAVPAWLAVPSARLHLLAGDHRQARAIAARSVWDAGTPRRDKAQLLLVHAVAALRMGDREAARGAVRMLSSVREPDEVASLATLPAAERAELLGEIELTKTAAARLDHARPVFPERIDLVALTNREHRVLTELAQGHSPQEIARSLVVSVATVRSQLQSVYRKLGASNRDEAIMRTYELGLL